MYAYAAVPVALWLATFVAMPRKPLPGNEMAELVYTRLLGRQQRLLLLAFVVSAATFFAVVFSLPSRVADDARTLRPAPATSGIAACSGNLPNAFQSRYDYAGGGDYGGTVGTTHSSSAGCTP